MPATLNNTGVLFNDSSQQNTAFIGESAQAFTSSGTFTIPTGVTKIKVTVVGGGGGGSAAITGSCCTVVIGRGGGAGCTAIKWLTGLTPAGTLSVTIGAGGSGGLGNLASPATAGGQSSVASGTQSITTISANGGGAATAGGVPGSGSSTSSGADLTFGGSSGTLSLGSSIGGIGGNSVLSSFAVPTTTGSSVAGGNYGGGGSGHSVRGAGNNGGAGAAGLVLIEW